MGVMMSNFIMIPLFLVVIPLLGLGTHILTIAILERLDNEDNS